MKARLPFVMLLASAPLMLRAQAPDSTLIRKADELVNARDCKGAEQMLAPLLTRRPPHPQAIIAKARCHLRTGGDATESLKELQAALDQGSRRFDIIVYRGDLYNDMRMFDRADADLTEAVELASDTADLVLALNRRAWNSTQMRRAGNARADCERVLAMDSTNRTALNNMGLAADQLGDTALALRCLQRMIALDPKEPLAWLNSGFFLGSHGRHAEALAQYAEAERLGAKDAYFLNNRGYSRLGVGDLKGARKDMERSIELNKTNPYAFRNLAHLELAAGNVRKACDAMEQSLSLGFTRMYGEEIYQLRKQHCH